MSKNGKFLYLVTSKRKFEGYWRFEFIKSSYIFLVALHRFCFIKIVSKIPNFQFFYFENSLWWLLWVNASSHFQRICSGTRYGNSKLIWNSYTVLATLFCFLFRISFFFTSKNNLCRLLCAKGVHSLPENMNLNKIWMFQIFQIHLNCFGITPPILL